MMDWLRVLVLSCLLAWVPFTALAEEDEEEYDWETYDDRKGSLRLGMFAIDNIDARVYFGPKDIPLRAVVDINRDLGIKDSILAARGNFQYRFSKHHAMSIGYYKLNVDGVRRLSTEIEIGDTVFDIGLDVRSQYEEQITKLAYNWIFHDEGRVLLSVTPGIHFTKSRLAVRALGTGDIGGIGLEARERASVTAPLPMLGGRLVYRLNEKWSVIAISDVFFLDRGSQEGQLNDSHIFLNYRANDSFSFGGGLNRFSLDLQLVDGDTIWDWSSVYTGAYLYVGMHF